MADDGSDQGSGPPVEYVTYEEYIPRSHDPVDEEDRYALRIFKRQFKQQFTRMLPEHTGSRYWKISCTVSSLSYPRSDINIHARIHYHNVLPNVNWDQPQGAMVLVDAGLLSFDCASLVDDHCGYPDVEFRAVYIFDSLVRDPPLFGKGTYRYKVKTKIHAVVNSVQWYAGSSLHRDFYKAASIDIANRIRSYYQRGLRHRGYGLPALISTKDNRLTYYHRGQYLMDAIVDSNGRITSYGIRTFSISTKRRRGSPRFERVALDDGKALTVDEFRKIAIKHLYCAHCRPDAND
jgi:hypothetical protein